MNIDLLQDELLTEFQRDPKGPRAARMLGEYASSQDDWRRFAFFDPDHYTRNLVHSGELFEMMIVCWGEGQESPIHCHAGQNCWMTVLEGQLEEIHYELPAPGSSPIPGSTRLFEPGGVAFINDDIALHRVRPLAGQRGVSLHVYACPIETCNVYCEETGTVEKRVLEFHSVAGSLS